MRGLSHLKGAADIRTAISTHYRSTARHEGTPFLEIMALGMEKLRLNRELEWLGKRQERVRRRLTEIKTLTDITIGRVHEDDPADPQAPRPQQLRVPGPWPTMTVEY